MAKRGRPPHPDVLTPREWEVLGLIRDDLGNEEIAKRLDLTVSGVKYHVSEILSKLGLENRADAARWASQAEERPGEWWALAIAPLSNLRLLRVRWLPSLVSAALAAVVAIAVGVFVWALVVTRGSDATPQPPDIDAVLAELGPGTTVHMLNVRYRRYGPAEEIYARYFPESGPETLTNETWLEFDEDGKLVDVHTESRREDGSVYRRTKFEDGEMIEEDGDGVEVERRPLGFSLGGSVEELRQTYRDAIEQGIARLDEYPDAPSVTLHDIEVLVLETRREFTRTLSPASASSFSAPYLYDLQPVEEIRRSYVLPDGRWGLRSEIVVIGADGTETVVESTDHLVFEVIDS